MQISVDILSLMAPRTEPGAGARQRAGPIPEDSSRFEKVFEEAMTGADSAVRENKKPEIAGKPDRPELPKKTDEDPDETLAAGMMAEQETVVFILEGDKESATTLTDAIQVVDGAFQIDTETDAPVIEPEPDKPVAESLNTAPDTTVETMVETAADTGAQAIVNEPVITQTPKAAGQPDDTSKVRVALDAKEEIGGAEGEVTARMPEIRTSEPQENYEDNPEFSGNGDLSPLENENDAAPAKGRKDKTYADTEEAVRNSAETTHEPVNNALPPLAHGIEPERFAADQELRQIEPGAPVRAENLFDEMVSRIESMKTESAHTMTIQLKPEFLGKVALEIAMDAAGLHVKINAANNDVRFMLNGQINALIESLEHKGIEVVEVEVAYTGIDNGAFRDSGEGAQSQSNRPRRSYREIDPVDGAAYYAELPIDILDYYLDAGVSSVEYRA